MPHSMFCDVLRQYMLYNTEKNCLCSIRHYNYINSSKKWQLGFFVSVAACGAGRTGVLHPCNRGGAQPSYPSNKADCWGVRSSHPSGNHSNLRAWSVLAVHFGMCGIHLLLTNFLELFIFWMFLKTLFRWLRRQYGHGFFFYACTLLNFFGKLEGDQALYKDIE